MSLSLVNSPSTTGAMASAKGGVVKPVRRSTRTRRQYNPEAAYDATAYMKSPAKIEVQATASPVKARSTALGSWLNAVFGMLDSMKLKLSVKSWRAVSKKKTAAKSKPVSKKTAAAKQRKLKKASK